jgi:O-antigen/teichoic acid export membrane protein
LSKIKSLAGDTVLYGLGSIVPRVINFFLLLPQTSVFSPEEYSVTVDLYAWVAFLNTLYTFGMETAYFRFATKEGADIKRVFNTAQTAVTTITFGLSLLFVLLAAPIANGLSIPEHPDYILWIVGIISVDALVAIPFARLRLEKKAFTFAIAKIINVLVIVALNFYFLKVAYDPSIGVLYVFMINLLGNALYIFFFIKTFLRWRPLFDKAMFSSMISYAYPIMLTGLAGMTNEMFSRITLKYWLPENFYRGKSSEYALGVFGACYKFAVFMNVAVQAFRFAAEPFFFSNANDKNSPVLFATINHYFIIVCCILLFGVSVNLDIFKHLLRDQAYWEGLGIVPILLTAYLFLGVYYNLTVWFKLTDRTYYGTIITVVCALITVLMNYFLIPVAGYTGSSWAALICYFFMATACYMIGQRYYPIPYRIMPGLAYIAGTLLIIYGIYQIKILEPTTSLILKNGLFLAYLIVIYVIERRTLRTSLGL